VVTNGFQELKMLENVQDARIEIGTEIGDNSMPNPNAIPLNLDTELGIAIKGIIPKAYGDSTFIVKEFMEIHKEELVNFWNQQGKDGIIVFDKWYSKWSMTRDEQDNIRKQKEQEKHNQLVKQYLALGIPQEESEELANAFPDKDPIEVKKRKGYSEQKSIGQSVVQSEYKVIFVLRDTFRH